MPPGIRLPGMSASSGASGPGAFNSQGGAPSFDMGTVQSLLEHFGVVMPGSFSDAGPFEQSSQDQGASVMGKLLGVHPAIGRAMDNALITAALTKQGRTTGENISNVAQGLLGVQPYRRQEVSAQAQAPLEFAKAIGGLQAQKAQMDMYAGMGDYYRQLGIRAKDQGEAALGRNTTAIQNRMLMAQVDQDKTPRIGVNGMVQTWQYKDPSDPLSGQYVDDPRLNPQDVRRQTERQLGGAAFQEAEGLQGAMPDPTRDPKAYSAWWNTKHDRELNDKIKVYGTQLNMRQGAGPSLADQMNRLHDDSKTALASEQKNLTFNATDQKAYQKQLRSQIYASGIKLPDGTTIAAGDPGGADAAASRLTQLEVARRQQAISKVSEAGQQYQKLILQDPQRASGYGSLQGYMQSPEGGGYDFNTHSFNPAAIQQQRPAGSPAQAPSPMSMQPKTPGNPASMDPNVQAIMRTLMTP